MTTLAQATTSVQPLLSYVAMGCIIAGLGIIGLVLMTFVKRSRAGQPPLTDLQDAGASTGTTEEAERLLRLMGDAEEQAARLSAQLIERSQDLQRLIAIADQRIAALQTERATPLHQPVMHVPSPVPVPTPVVTMPIHRAAPPAAPVQQHQPPLRVVTRPVELGPTETETASAAFAPPAPAPSHSMTPAATERVLADAQALRDQLLALEARLSAATPSVPVERPREVVPEFEPVTHAPRMQPPAASPAPSASPPTQRVQVEGSSETLAASIYRLADQGMSAAQIASRLGQQLGTVELFLALRGA